MGFEKEKNKHLPFLLLQSLLGVVKNSWFLIGTRILKQVQQNIFKMYCLLYNFFQTTSDKGTFFCKLRGVRLLKFLLLRIAPLIVTNISISTLTNFIPHLLLETNSDEKPIFYYLALHN